MTTSARECYYGRVVADRAGQVSWNSQPGIRPNSRHCRTVAGASAGLLRPLATTTVARAIVGLLLHTVSRTIVEEGRADGLRALAEELLDFELYGLLAPAARAKTPATPALTTHTAMA